MRRLAQQVLDGRNEQPREPREFDREYAIQLLHDVPQIADPIVEAAIDRFWPRPHWGKMHARTREQVAAQFDRFADFRDLCRRHDPDGKFVNDYLRRYVLAG
jgi:hypothetical protein